MAGGEGMIDVKRWIYWAHPSRGGVVVGWSSFRSHRYLGSFESLENEYRRPAAIVQERLSLLTIEGSRRRVSGHDSGEYRLW